MRAAEMVPNIKLSILFQDGFRIFFLLASLLAIFNLTYWLLFLSGQVELYSHFSPSDWHYHEMAFGFIGAAIAGFILTALPNWTGQAKPQPSFLMVLAALFIAGRIAVNLSAHFDPFWVMMVDVNFYFVLAIFIFRRLIAAKLYRNFPIAIMISLIGVINLIFHLINFDQVPPLLEGLTYFDLIKVHFALISLLIMLIGGRIIPNFSKNWLKQQGVKNDIKIFCKIDGASILFAALSLLIWVFFSGLFGAIMLILTALFQLYRMSRWGIFKIYKNSMLLILQIAYLWLILGIFAMGMAYFSEFHMADIAFHMMAIGGFSMMIMAIITRASLGHSGQKIRSNWLFNSAFILLNLSAITRIVYAMHLVESQVFLHISVTFWQLSFLLILIKLIPLYLKPRLAK